MKLSVIIPHRGNNLGLWATVHSCESDLVGLGIDYEYVIVTNGEPVDRETSHWLDPLVESGKAKHVHSPEALSPPKARSMGVVNSSGELLFFFDNHCVVQPQYFRRAVLIFDNREVDCLHSTTCFHTSNGDDYHYKLRLDFNFWAESAKTPEEDYKPYEVAAGGHGGFAVRRSVWDAVGGYGPDYLLEGYGGEELIFDLKLWRMGYKVHLDPLVKHYHYTGNRGYSRHYTDDYYKNLMVSALVIGGESWLRRVYESFAYNHHIRVGKRPTNMYDLMIAAYYRGAEYSKTLDSVSKYDLDTLLQRFKREQVAH